MKHGYCFVLLEEDFQMSIFQIAQPKICDYRYANKCLAWEIRGEGNMITSRTIFYMYILYVYVKSISRFLVPSN